MCKGIVSTFPLQFLEATFLFDPGAKRQHYEFRRRVKESLLTMCYKMLLLFSLIAVEELIDRRIKQQLKNIGSGINKNRECEALPANGLNLIHSSQKLIV